MFAVLVALSIINNMDSEDGIAANGLILLSYVNNSTGKPCGLPLLKFL